MIASPEIYSKPCQTSTMDSFAKIIHSRKLKAVKSSILNFDKIPNTPLFCLH